MAEIDLSRPQAIHLVYVGGKAMSAMAEILLAMGHRVSGSDPLDLPVLDRLRALGASVHVGDRSERVVGADLVACSSAVPPDHPELLAARASGVAVVARPALQGAIAKLRRCIAISGTHGKTSTTAMLATILADAGWEPSYMVGGDLGREVGGARWSDGDWLVVEADESDGTFLELHAEVAVVTSIAADHLDRFGSLAALESAFDVFLGQARTLRVVCADDPAAARLGARHGAVSYGVGERADYRLRDVRVRPRSTTFTFGRAGSGSWEVTIPEPGVHNALNASAALSVAHSIGVPMESAVRSLASYPGVGRRFDVKGETAGVTVVDDYAHNPGKVRAVLDAARDAGWPRVVAVFQPHRYSRTSDLAGDFADSFGGADVVIVTELDPAGEPPMPGVSGKSIVDAVAVAHPGKDVRWVPEWDRLIPVLLAELHSGDLCLTVGAGSITRLGPEILAALEAEG